MGSDDLVHTTCLPFETETSARNDHVPYIIAKRFQRVSLKHCPDVSQFSGSLLAIVGGDKSDTLCQWQICPVDTFRVVAVVGLDEIVEDLPLVLVHGMYRVMCTAHVGPVRGCWTVVLYVGHCGGRIVCVSQVQSNL